MSNNKLTGKVIAVMNKQQVTDTFAKREFVIETDEQYPQQVKFELTNDKCDLIDNHKIGETITVHFNVRGRSWTNKQNETVYFVSVNAWRLEAEAQSSAGTGQTEPPENQDLTDDLPFSDSTK